MKKFIGMILLLCFSFVAFADVGTSPPIEKPSIEIVIEQNFDVMVFTHQVYKPIIFVEVEISPGDLSKAIKTTLKSQSNSYCVNKIALLKTKANRLDLKKSGTERYHNIVNSDFIKLSENINKENYRKAEHRIRGHDNMFCDTI